MDGVTVGAAAGAVAFVSWAVAAGLRAYRATRDAERRLLDREVYDAEQLACPLSFRRRRVA